MPILLLPRMSTWVLTALCLCGLLATARADSILAPTTDQEGILSLRGGQLTGNQLRAYLYEAAATAPPSVVVKLDGVEQPAVKVQPGEDAHVPIDVMVLLELGDSLRTPATLQAIQTALNKLAAGVYDQLGGKMGIVSCHRGFHCFPKKDQSQKVELAGSKADFASAVGAIDSYLPAKGQADDTPFEIVYGLEYAAVGLDSSPPGRAKVILLISDGQDKNSAKEQADIFSLKAESAKTHSTAVMMLLLSGDVQGTPRKREPFAKNLCQPTGGLTVDVKVNSDPASAFTQIHHALFDQVLLAGPLTLPSNAAPGQKHQLTLASGARSMAFEVAVSADSPAAAPNSSSSGSPSSSQSSFLPARVSGEPPVRRWLALGYAAVALLGALLILLISRRQNSEELLVELAPSVVLPPPVPVPGRPVRAARPARPAEWLGASSDRLPSGGMAWLYAPRTRRTHLLLQLPFRVGSIADSHVVLRLRGPLVGCEFQRDQQSGRISAQPLTEQPVEIRGQRVSHSVELADCDSIRIGGEEFRFFQIRTGGERVA